MSLERLELQSPILLYLLEPTADFRKRLLTQPIQANSPVAITERELRMLDASSNTPERAQISKERDSFGPPCGHPVLASAAPAQPPVELAPFASTGDTRMTAAKGIAST
jgi:hypothetical protein